MPSFYYRFKISAIMREVGFVDCTPDNVSEYDEYDVNSALLYYDMENDSQLKKAREQANKRKQGKLPKPSGRNRSKVTGGDNNHLTVV